MSGEQASELGTGLRCPHEGFAHQKGVNIGIAHAFDIIRSEDAGFGDDQLVWRDARQEIDRGIETGFESSQIRLLMPSMAVFSLSAAVSSSAS